MEHDENGVPPETVLESIFGVRGRRVLVTGAGSGLGFAIAQVMADCGAKVVAVDRDEGALERACEVLGGRAYPIEPVQADLGSWPSAGAVVARAVERHGGIDAVFLNAGIAQGPAMSEEPGTLEGTTEADWSRVVGVNLDAVFAMLQACAPVMKEQRSGRIVITASTAGLRADPLVSYSYAASKAGVVNLVRQAALELAPYGICVNGIAPGPFRTNIGAARRAAAEAAGTDTPPIDWARTVPLGRMGEPDELKGLALLLASGASSFMTGGIYPIDGGALVAYAR